MASLWAHIRFRGARPRPLRLAAATALLGMLFLVEPVWQGPRPSLEVATVAEAASTAQVGQASWYGAGFHGRRTASGEVFNQNAMVAAHRTLKLQSRVRVTNLVNGRSVVVRVVDRGPHVRGKIIDVSRAAASRLGFLKTGTTKVRLEVLSVGR